MAVLNLHVALFLHPITTFLLQWYHNILDSNIAIPLYWQVSSVNSRRPVKANTDVTSLHLHFFAEPCCPVNVTVNQVTPAITSVSWSHAKGAHSFITSLTSRSGSARCRTQDSQCLMGCITCGTNYTVAMEVFSHSKHMSNCTYQGFSSSEWCC